MNHTELSIIIPARREEGTILSTLHSLQQSVKTPHAIYVVDDSINNNDKTPDIVARYARTHRNIHVVRKNYEKNKSGFAAAIKRGVDNLSPTNAVVIVMADLCDDPKIIDDMYRKIVSGADVVCGSRYMTGGKKVGGPWLQDIMSTVVNFTLHHITRITTRDLSNAFKMYRYELLKKIPIDESLGVELSMKMILQAYEQGADIVEIPTTWIGRTVGESKFKIIERFPQYIAIYQYALYALLKRALKTRKTN